MPCSIQIAQNIAFYGKPAVSAGDSPRVPGWNQSSQLTITPATPPTVPDENAIVHARGSTPYQGSPIFSAVFGNDSFDIAYEHYERYIGW